MPSAANASSWVQSKGDLAIKVTLPSASIEWQAASRKVAVFTEGAWAMKRMVFFDMVNCGIEKDEQPVFFSDIIQFISLDISRRSLFCKSS